METINKKQLYQANAAKFNFELNADEILEKALEVKLITRFGDDEYIINELNNEIIGKFLNGS